jgi:hypothetical protein
VDVNVEPRAIVANKRGCDPIRVTR